MVRGRGREKGVEAREKGSGEWRGEGRGVKGEGDERGGEWRER